jgi:ribose transport system substrate-binding protein
LRRKKTFASVLAVLLGVIAVGAMSLASGASGNAASALKTAIAKTKAAEHGTNKLPNETKRPVAKGKNVFIISAGQASESSAIPAAGAVAAAKVLGWNVHVLDGALNPSTYPGLVSQAIAQGAQGIILDAVDCSVVKAPLTQAKAKKIVVVPIYAFDCNDKVGGSPGAPSLFTTCENYNGLACNNLGNFTESYGADQANYIIAKTNNKAKVLVVQDPEYTVLKYTAMGFDATIKASGGSQVVATQNFDVADLLAGKVKGIVQKALLQHSNVNWVKSPYAAATTLGQLGAAAHAAGKDTMGGEGFPDELALVKNGTITAINVIDSKWTAWAAIDAMNSAFNGNKKGYPSGIGWTIVDKTNDHIQAINYQAAYKKAWGK